MVVFAGAVVVGLFVAAAVVAAVRWGEGSRPPATLLLSLPLLAGGAWFWFGFIHEEPVERSWTWLVAVILGLIALLAAFDAGRAAKAMLVTVVAVPLANAAHVAWMHVNVPANRLYDLADAIAAVTVAPLLYCPPAIATWLLLYLARPTSPGVAQPF